MPKNVTPLSSTQVKQAKPKAKEYNLCDGKGLMLRVKPNGSKLWLFNYTRPFTKKRANMSLGAYPDLSLQNARAKRSESLALLAQDIDPKQSRDKEQLEEREKHSNTLEQVARRWFEVKKSSVTAGYADDIWRSLELHIFPTLGNVPIHLLEAKTTIENIKPIAAKGSLETVKRLCQRLNEIMIFATNTGLIHHNPLAGIKKVFKSPVKQGMPSITPQEIPAFIQALSNASINKTTRHLIEWQLHTMVRPSEAAGTRWDEIDFDNQLWHIPANRMKKNRAHTVPLSDQAIEILDKMRPISEHREYVFVSHRDPKRHTHAHTANVAIKRMGYGGKLVAHGLRALASTTLNEQGFDGDIVEAALAHIDKNETRRAYNRAEYLEQRRDMMAWWSDHIYNNVA